MGIQTRFVEYQHGDVVLQGELAWDDASGPKPVVLVAHTWAGRTDFEGLQAKRLAEMGYVGFAVDMYGKGIVGTSVEENTALMTPLVSDRALLQARMAAAADAALAQSDVCDGRLAAMGFCFGGLCVLDLARSSAVAKGVVSFHGLFFPADNLPAPKISSKVLALHGYDDPMATPDALLGFAKEMTDAGADWQVHAYGNTMHAFTNPEADNKDMGTVYNPVAADRAFRSLGNFLQELFH